MKLEGKVALVTGAGSGIGQAIALLFASEGADIAVNDIDLPSAEKTAAAVKKAGRRSIAIQADISDPEAVNAMVDRVIAELGGVNILANNAGISIHGSALEEQTVENWDRVINVVLRGTYLCSRKAGQWMADNGGGAIVNTSSGAGLYGSPIMIGYGAGKAGVINLTQSLAIEWGKYNIRINALAPGVIDTPLTQRTFLQTSTAEQISERFSLGRLGTAHEVAKVALFLVCDDSSYVTGVTIPVDGGRMR